MAIFDSYVKLPEGNSKAMVGSSPKKAARAAHARYVPRASLRAVLVPWQLELEVFSM